MEIKATIVKYCDYQERCQSEVRNKLYELGCKTLEVESLISELIEQGLLNEERYARAIARGKFRIKGWGRNKIIQQLKQKRISDYCIKAALKEINPEEYWNTLLKTAERKLHELRTEKNPIARRIRLQRYLLQKGFENQLIQDAMNEIINATK